MKFRKPKTEKEKEFGICDFCGEEGEIVDVIMSRTMAGFCVCAKCAAPKENK